jgi:hypothetical protein
MSTKVDHALLQANQAAIVALLLIATLFNWVWLVAFVAAVMLVGSVWPRAGLFKLAAQRLLRPLGLFKADVRADLPQPHLFAQAVGGFFLVAALAVFWGGLSWLGWALTAIVIVLAAINLLFGFCAGCFMYYQLGKLGIKPHLPTWQGTH